MGLRSEVCLASNFHLSVGQHTFYPTTRSQFSLTQGLKKNKTLSNLLGSEAYRG